MLKRPILTVKATCDEWRALIALADNGAIAKATLPGHVLATGPEMPPQVAAILFERCRQLFFALCESGRKAMFPPGRWDDSVPLSHLELTTEAAKRSAKTPEAEPIIPYKAEGPPWLGLAGLAKMGLPDDFVAADEALKKALDVGNPEPIERQATDCFELCNELLDRIGNVVCLSVDPVREVERQMERQKRIDSGQLAKVIPFQAELFSR